MKGLDLTEAQVAGFMAVEDVLIDFRDSRISIFGYANGVVVNERDGTPNSMVRMRTRHATDLAIETAAPLIEAQALRNAADALDESYGSAGTPRESQTQWEHTAEDMLAMLRARADRISRGTS